MTTATAEKQAMTIAETAKSLGVSERHLRYLLKRGDIRSVRAGKKWLVPTQAIEEFLGNRELK